MKRNGSNFLRATLIKIKIPNDINISSFVLKMEFCKQIHETERLTGREVDLNKSFFFDIPIVSMDNPENQNNTFINFELTALSKTLLFFDSQIGKLSIQLILNNLNDQKEWFTLRNTKELNTLMVLMSFEYIREKQFQQIPKELSNSIQNENHPVVNSSYLLNNSIDNKIKIIPKDFRQNSVNKTYSADNNVNSKNSRALNSVNNNYFNNSNTPNIHISLVNPDMNCTQEVKSKVSLIVSNPKVAPCRTHRNTTTHEAISTDTLNMIQIKNPLKGDETQFLTTIESGLDDENDWLGLEFIDSFQSNEWLTNKLNITADKLNIRNNHSLFMEDKEKITKMKDCLKLYREKLKSYEAKIMKEKENLEQNIRKFKQTRESYGNRFVNFKTNFSKLENQLEKAKLQKNLIETDKQNFFNINLMIKSNSITTDYNISQVNKLLATINKTDFHENMNNNIKFNNDTRVETVKEDFEIKSTIFINESKAKKNNTNNFAFHNNSGNIYDTSRDFVYRETDRERDTQSIRGDSANSAHNGINNFNSNSILNKGLNGGNGYLSLKDKLKNDKLAKPQISNGSQSQDIPIRTLLDHNSPQGNKKINLPQKTKISLNSGSKKKELSTNSKKENSGSSGSSSKITVTNPSNNIVSISNMYSSNPSNKQDFDAMSHINSPKGKSNRPASMQIFKPRISSEDKNLHNSPPENGIKITQMKNNSETINMLKNNKTVTISNEKANGIDNNNNINFSNSTPLTNKTSIGTTNNKKTNTKTNVNPQFRKEISGSFVQQTPTTFILNTIVQGNNVAMSTQKSVANVRKK